MDGCSYGRKKMFGRCFEIIRQRLITSGSGSREGIVTKVMEGGRGEMEDDVG